MLPQDPSMPSPGGNVLRDLVDALHDPAVLEVTAAALAAAALVWILLSVRSSLGKLRGRRLLVKYLDGVEAGFAGDPEAATDLLGAVVRADPENVGARLALGDALYKLRRPAEAHRHHMEARQVFDAGGSAVQLALVRDLEAAGEVTEAIVRVDEALREHPRDPALLDVAWRLKTEAGLFEEALPAGRALCDQRGGKELRRRLAVTAARAGMLRLSRGDAGDAAELFGESLGYDPDNHDARTGRMLLAPEPDIALLPGPDASGGRSPGPGDPSRAAALLQFFPEAVCPSCSSPRDGSGGRCAVCGGDLPPVYAERELAAPIEDPDGSLDEIEENEAWFRKLASATQDGDAAAAALLDDGGAAALLPLVAVLVERGDTEDRLRDACVRLGRRFPAALLAARDALVAEGRGVLDRLTGRLDVDPLLAPVFRRLGPAARDSFQDLVADGGRLRDRGLRSLVVDYFLGLGDLAAFEELAARYAPVEIVRKLNRVPPAELAPLFALLPEGPSFLREAILLDPALDQPEALARAALRAGAEGLPRFVDLFARRGPGPQVLQQLVRDLGGPDAAAAEALLGHFAAGAVELLVAGFADPDAPAAAQQAIRRLLAGCGPAAVPELVRCFGSTPSDVDDRTIDLLVSFGEVAVPLLEKAYAKQVGWLGKLGANLLRGRHTRASIGRVLGRITGPAAADALGRLLDAETDAELASLLKEVLRTHGDRP